MIPAGSLLARWQAAATAEDRERLAHDWKLAEVGSARRQREPGRTVVPPARVAARTARQRGPAGKDHNGTGASSRSIQRARRSAWTPRFLASTRGPAIDPASLCVQAPERPRNTAAGRHGGGV